MSQEVRERRRYVTRNSGSPLPSLSVIVPFHRGLAALARSLGALTPAEGIDVIVVADGAIEDCGPVATRCGARVIAIDGPLGPAAARNRGVAVAQGEVLVFVDADVVASSDALSRIRRLLAERPGVAAVFGTYDDAPLAENFVSQYRNLLHTFTHQASNHQAFTFWAGLGAVRASAFRAVGGFDERFGRPSIEDIELGYRLRAAGHHLVLDRRLHGTHLKRWTLRSMIVADLFARGIPWMRLILRSGVCPPDLNISHAARLSVLLSYLLVLSLVCAVSLASAPWLSLAVACAGLLLLVNRPMLRFMRLRRGWRFAAGAAGMNVLFHLLNGVSAGVGVLLHVAASVSRVRGTGRTINLDHV